MRLAKDQLKRARKRFKEARREARRARKLATDARRGVEEGAARQKSGRRVLASRGEGRERGC